MTQMASPAIIRNFLITILIFILLIEYLGYDLETKFTICSRTYTPVEENNESISFAINIKQIKKYYSTKGDFFIPSSLKLKDWHNYTQIELDKLRVGLGEQGKPAELPKEKENLQNKLKLRYNGYNAALSDVIALNRSVPDIRHPGCKKRLYIESLPQISVIIPFRNERRSTVLRTVYSVINRSPAHLIKEIFLVDDGSDEEYMEESFDSYVEENLPQVKVLHLENHSGLVAARLAGAAKATADVIVFLDCHIEANVNWLPPLLEPIALDYRSVVIPIIDQISFQSLEYKGKDGGLRGTFDWELGYHRISLTPSDAKNLPEPFETPVMTGGLFAISRYFFWELGAFDPEIQVWGGEQYELSFKIWQCGGRLLEAPCSRFGHSMRHFNYPDHDDWVYRNFRRVADVWMDEYAQFMYARIPFMKTIDPGDLTERKALRKQLKCKPFKWYITQIAFDLTQNYPEIEPLPYAEGRIRPVKNPHLCVDGSRGNGPILLKPCHAEGLKLPPQKDDQQFMLTRFNDVRLKSRFFCWDVNTWMPGTHVKVYECHREENQKWKYYENLKRFVFIGYFIGKCLDYNPTNRELFINFCDEKSETQLWQIDTVHKEEMAKWSVLRGLPITGPTAKWEE